MDYFPADSRLTDYLSVLQRRPCAASAIKGSEEYPSIRGEVRFYSVKNGVLVASAVQGLPVPAGPCQSPVFAFHIHSGNTCTGNCEDPFADVRTHYDPDNCPHPYHAGDMPPLFASNGRAFSVFLTNRFSIENILGRTVILHAGPDDFTSQPAGNAGKKIACGEIRALSRCRCSHN